eukprot:GHRR01018881.1.p1 GENE.GHRR01018881.1~~GHRR01018881.1.p1  ORF type:complete len:190 (+),score=66.03 GHRR01018881.1:821-1390(+)
MGPYQDLLQYAETLGFTSASDVATTSATFAESDSLVEKCLHLCSQELRLQALTDYMGSRIMTDQLQIQSRTQHLDNTVQTLNMVCTNKDAVADRLRSAKTRPSVPVNPAYQPYFTAMLKHSASSAGILHHGAAALHWAATLNDKPSCWEDQLKCILEAAKDISSCITATDEFNTAIRSSTSSKNQNAEL